MDFPDLLRGIITTTANVLLMTTLLQPKYGKKVTTLTMLSILVVDLGTAIYCYMSGNLTLLAKLDVILFTGLCFVVRPMFKDTFMQWLFSYLTLQNISDAVIILSFMGARHLPYQPYGHSVLRLILFGVVIFVLAKFVRPLYRQAVEHWTSYFVVALSINVAFGYYVLSSDNIIKTFTEQAVPLLLVIIIGFASYISIFLSLKNLQREYQVKEENQRMQSERDYLQLASSGMAERIKLMEEVSAQNSRAAHDQRHFNRMILEFLEQDEIEEAQLLLKGQVLNPSLGSRIFCENPVVNAAVSHYVKLAEQLGVKTTVQLDIPRTLPVDSLELSMAVSNLLENAILSTHKQSEHIQKTVVFTCRYVGRLLLEIENPCEVEGVLDENGYPVAQENGHGIGSKSVIAFAKKYDGELFYTHENGVFRVRLLV